jgi:hypothetical protein
MSSGGIFLGEATNNVVEYSVVIELLCDALSHGISHLLGLSRCSTGRVSVKWNIPVSTIPPFTDDSLGYVS